MSIEDNSLALPPGTPVYVGEPKTSDIIIKVIEYNTKKLKEYTIADPNKELPELHDDSITWVNVIGLHNVPIIEKLTAEVKIDPILLEDIVNTSRRPKIEDVDDYFFFIIKDLVFDKENVKLDIEHMAFVVGKNFVFTFQETETDNFNTIRERMRKSIGAIRKSQVDYLFNRLLDAIVDNYFIVIQDLGELIDEMEDMVVINPTRDTLTKIQHLKQETILIRRICLPVREVVGIMIKLETIVISANTLVFVRSIFDHLNQIIDSIEIYREMLSGFLDIYLSSLSNKTNDVMKVLTIVTSVFIPLSFLVGLYGMNFDYMPELSKKWAYPFLLLVMISISSSMLYYFKRIGWLNLN